jgi:LPXTG-motif cell wall-anchored protein
MSRMERTFALRSLVAAALMAITLTFFAGAATATDYDNPPPPSTGNPSPPADDAATAAQTVHRDNPLPVTGSDLVGLGAIGGGLVLVGGGVLLARRRHA